MKNFIKYFLSVFILSFYSCTEFYFQVQNESNDLIIGRTLDVSSKEPCVIVVENKIGQTIHSGTPLGINNISKTVLYKWLSITSFAQEDFFCEAINNVGLKVSALFFPETTYVNGLAAEANNSVNVLSFAKIILATCATAEEAAELIDGHIFWAPLITDLIFNGVRCPFHIIITDSNGDGIVVEIENGVPTIYENNTHVVTNTPSYDYHLKNIRNLIVLKSENTESEVFNGINYDMMGHGNGFYGLPGDFTSTSRFLRVFYLLNNVSISDNIEDGIILVQNILGAVRVSDGLSKDDLTTWETIITKDEIYIRNYDYQSYKKIDISSVLENIDGWSSNINDL
jgi:penicillin V acylase-like amidase (Ntn superfamily)